MNYYLKYLFIILILIILGSCTTKELDVGYGRPCFNKSNEFVYIKVHQYFHWNYALLFQAEVYDSYRYLCQMDFQGNEEVVDIIPVSIAKLSEGNGKICIQTGSYDAYTYIDGEFKEILSDVRVDDAILSFNGEKIAYVNTENDEFIITVADINGENRSEYGVGFVKSWHPDNNRLVYLIAGEYYLLDTTTSNTQTIPYAYKWSHDEQRIAYYNEDDHLVLMNWDTTGQVVTDWVDTKNRVEWSYDGEYLLSGFSLLDKDGILIRYILN